MDQLKINNWLNSNYQEIVNITKKITQNKEYRDIAHYIIIEFIDNKRAMELIDKNEALKYITGMVYNSYHSKTSPWARSNPKNLVYNEPLEIIEDEYDYETDILIEQIKTILEEKQTDIVIWYELTLLKMWIENPNYSYLAKQLNIPRTTISNSVKGAKEYIKNKIKDNGTDFN